MTIARVEFPLANAAPALHASCRRGWSALLVALATAGPGFAAGVTVITHGFESNVVDWIIPMTEAMPGYSTFPGSTFSCYEISVTKTGSQFNATAIFLGGTSPVLSNSGEILVKLDWSTVSGAFQATTSNVAQAAASALLAANLIPEMNGRPLAELPLHLIGHSRGASVMTEIARLLGAQGVWVDQVTTLDPRPVSLFGDPGMTNWANVLYADNYWQEMGGLFDPKGQTIPGAYNRKLLDLNGANASSHSDVHLWYHGTIDLATPATDTQATITATQRSTWWTSAEMAGAATGFRYSLIGGGDRLGNFAPAGAGNGVISDGFNKNWPLGGSGSANRTSLPANTGLWPNPILFSIGTVDTIAAGESVAATLHYQAGTSTSGTVDVKVLLDPDFNPYNGNEFSVNLQALPKTGTGAVSSSTLEPLVNAAVVPPGTYAVHVRLTDGPRSRYLTSPRTLVVTPSRQAPSLDAASMVYDGTDIRITVHGFPGQVVTMETSDDLIEWTPVETHTFNGTIWEFVDTDVGDFTQRFYRAVIDL